MEKVMSDEPVSSRVTVLVADDDASVRRALSVLLRRAGRLEVVGVAGDGHEAATLAAEHRPEVAVVDMRMPGGGGEGIRRLVAASPGTAVIAYSAHGDPLSRQEAVEAGAGWFLVKGTDDPRLVATIHLAAGAPGPGAA